MPVEPNRNAPRWIADHLPSPQPHNIVYSTISVKETDHLDIQPLGSKEAGTFVNAFLKRSLPRLDADQIQTHLSRKAVILEHFLKKRKKQKRRKTKCLSAKERRELRIFELKPEQQRYKLFLPLHQLWKQYIRDLCNGLKPDTQTQMIQTKLLKADFHGAIVTVVKSKCPSYVGVTGIILQEMKHIFKIITVENKLKAIPKQNSIFSVEIDGFVSYIYGSKFQLRSSERSAKKFKGKGSIDL
uniref:ribonuclease P protein subunit p29 isoform X2 n=1 Tax=Pristiophorus japonicus TaxID=55135 RepID=UPI00398EB2FC